MRGQNECRTSGYMTRVVEGAAMKAAAAVLLALLCLTAAAHANDHDDDSHYVNAFAVDVEGGLEEARRVARDLGYTVDRELTHIGVALLSHPEVHHRSKRSAESHIDRLRSHPKVRYVQQEKELIRDKRHILHDKQIELPIREIKDNSVYKRVVSDGIEKRNFGVVNMEFNDPYVDDMWYLNNRGQSGGEKYLDINIQPVWANGFNGEGVVVSILDDGIDHTHADLKGNYDPKASGDLNDKDDKNNDPMPNTTRPGNSHGTRCAGEIAGAANNGVCGVGVAYKARVGGVRILDGRITDSLESEALSYQSQYVDIYSASWGPRDDGKHMEGPHHFCKKALKDGVTKGRRGLGNLFVWATGNGGLAGDDCNADGYTNSVESLSVGSITDVGTQPYFMENCTSTLAVVPTGGDEYPGQERDNGEVKIKVVTTDVGGGCIENFMGTSSAAPLAAGCLANVLQANPSLTWRDVQHVVVHGTRVPSADASWIVNGGGLHVSRKFGFGLIDCAKTVQVAQNWRNVPEQHVCNYVRKEPQTLAYGGNITDTIYVDACKDDPQKWIQRLEHVQVRVKLNTRRRGDVSVYITSPAGTKSLLLNIRHKDAYKGAWEFTFLTVHSWDENPVGTWKLEIVDVPTDKPTPAPTKQDDEGDVFTMLKAVLKSHEEKKAEAGEEGYMEEWELILYGTAGDRYSRDDKTKKENKKKSVKLTTDEVQRIKRDETEASFNVQVKRSEKLKKRGHEKRTEDALSSLLTQLFEKRGSTLRTEDKRASAQHDSTLRTVEKRVFTPTAAEPDTRDRVHKVSLRERELELLREIKHELEELT